MLERDAGARSPPPSGTGAGTAESAPEPESYDPSLLRDALAVRDWLLAVAASADDLGKVLSGFAERLNALGMPVERMTTAIDTLHSEYSGIGRFWTREEGPSYRLFPHGPESDRIYAESPFALVHRTREWLLLDLSQTADNRFNIVPDLKAAGYRYYLVVPIFFASGSANGITFATRAPEGFSDRALALLRSTLPTLAFILEARALSLRLENVLRIYVGDGPHREILSGTIRRGQVNRVESTILFADMRDFTRITATLTPEAAVDLLNGYFDCLVPPIEAEGGEVLKYMGDGLLAIFRDERLGGAAAQLALNAAVNGLARLEAANRSGRFPAPIGVGIALHHGDAAYGNVGSGQRLDFTVIGRDVNLASRIAELNKRLGEPLLMSKPFVEHLWGNPSPLGAHEVEGFAEAIEVYKP
jgi:adenylate cyclase